MLERNQEIVPLLCVTALVHIASPAYLGLFRFWKCSYVLNNEQEKLVPKSLEVAITKKKKETAYCVAINKRNLLLTTMEVENRFSWCQSADLRQALRAF